MEDNRPTHLESQRLPTPPEDIRELPSFVQYATALYEYDSPHDAILDTYGIQLDGFLERVHAAEAYFDEHPQVEGIEVACDPPSHGTEEGAQKSNFILRRDMVFTLKEMASWRYDDLIQLSGIGHALARDITDSWDAVACTWGELVESREGGKVVMPKRVVPEWQKGVDQAG